ncbi:MAG: tetratricopeptide repeat protein [Patescibacteria group bacterium]|mgnify:FL=1
MTLFKVFLLSLVLSFAVFGNGIFGNFVFDDVSVVQNRPDVKYAGNFFDLFISPYHQNMSKTGLYRPLTMASYAINHYVNSLFAPSTSSGQAVGFHIVNIIIHAVSSFLVFWLVNFLFKKKFLSYAVFLLFLAHPIHTEAVTSIVGRAELLSFLFGVAGICFFIKNNKILSAASFLLALLSKESALMVLPIIFYISVVFSDIKIWDSFKKLWFFSLPLGFYALLRYKALGGYFLGDVTATMAENPLRFVSFSERISTAFKVLYLYLEKLIWPVHLSADYSFNAIKVIRSPFVSVESIVGILIFALLVAIIVFYKKVSKELSFSAALFLFPYMIISNLVKQIGTIMGERLMYFPSFGFTIVAALVLVKIYDYKKWGAKAAYGLLAVILAFYGARTFIRNKDWHDSRTLFYATVKESPDSLITRTALAGVHIRADEWDLAKEQLKIAGSIYEDNSHLQNLLGVVADHDGDYVLAEEKYKRSLELNSDAINSHINLAELYLKQGRLEEAGNNFLKVIDFYSTAEYIIRYSYIQIALNRPDKALDMINKYFVTIDNPEISALTGTAYFVKGDYKLALPYLKMALEQGNKSLEIMRMVKIAEQK